MELQYRQGNIVSIASTHQGGEGRLIDSFGSTRELDADKKLEIAPVSKDTHCGDASLV